MTSGDKKDKEGERVDVEPAETGGKWRGWAVCDQGHLGSQGHGACLTVAHPADFAGRHPGGVSMSICILAEHISSWTI